MSLMRLPNWAVPSSTTSTRSALPSADTEYWPMRYSLSPDTYEAA